MLTNMPHITLHLDVKKVVAVSVNQLSSGDCRITIHTESKKFIYILDKREHADDVIAAINATEEAALC